MFSYSQMTREVQTPAGYKVNSPDCFLLPLEALEAIDKLIQAAYEATGHETYAVYYNEDRDRPGRLHSLKVVMKKS